MTSDTYIRICSFVFGLILGSFANVLILRMPKNQSILSPGSHCEKCKKSLKWWQNIPLLSFVYLMGKCHFCKTKISLQYPIVELLTGVLFLAATVQEGLTIFLALRVLPFLFILVVVTFIDLRHRIIPDSLSLGGLLLGALTVVLDPYLPWWSYLLGGAFGFGFFYLISLGYYSLTQRIGLGGGDIKLLAMMGVFLGSMGVVTTVFVSSILGTLVGLGWAIGTRQKKLMKVAIPYGPFLVLGGIYYYFFRGKLWFQFMIPI